MQRVKEIRAEIGNTEALKLLSSAYSDVAGTKLLMIRSTIENNRQFVSELSTVFHIVRLAIEKQKISLASNKSGVANVVLSSNHRFYGGLESRLLSFYSAHTSLSHGDNFIVGQTGEAFLKTQPELSAKVITLAKDLPNTQELSALSDMLQKYEKVLVYHTRMQSVLVQRPVITEVGGLADIAAEMDPRLAYYIFEPEVKKMIEFFDRQVTKVLLEQAFLEAELARTAARLVSMEQAQTNSDLAIKQMRKLLGRAQASQANVRMLENVLGLVGRRRVD